MQISEADWIDYKNKLAAISDEAAKKLETWLTWKGGYQNVERGDLIAMAYGLITKYSEASASLAAEMYDEIATISGATVPAAEVADSATYGEVAKAINGVTKKVTTDNNLGNVVARYVKRAGADTTLKNVERDGAQFAWIPAGDTCPFCLMLASNGWQYQSKNAIKNGHASHIHANCDCTYAVRFDNKTNVKGYNPEKYREMYYNAEGKTPQERINSMRRIHYQENRDKILAQKKANYAAKKPDFAERSLRTKSSGNYGVNWKIVKSKDYTERFNGLSDNQKANELAAQRARNALVNRNGKKTEEIYAISLTTGKDVSKIIDQHKEFGVDKTDKFMADILRAEDNYEKVLLIHNHPSGTPPSYADINELLNHKSAVGITVGHNGSIYYYTKPNKEITDFDINVAKRKAKRYNDSTLQRLAILEELAKEFGFIIKEM